MKNKLIRDFIRALTYFLIGIAAYIWLFSINWKIGLAVLLIQSTTNGSMDMKYEKKNP